MKNANGYLKYASPLAFFLLLCTMVGALLIEFFVRPSPEIMLVSIAIILIAGALFGIKYNKATILSVLSSD